MKYRSPAFQHPFLTLNFSSALLYRKTAALPDDIEILYPFILEKQIPEKQCDALGKAHIPPPPFFS